MAGRSRGCRAAWAVALAALLGVLVGCGTDRTLLKAQGSFRDGRAESAAQVLSRALAKADRGDDDALLLALELGAARRAAGAIPGSEEAFERAEQEVEYFDEQPAISLSREMGAMLTNLNNLPYRGTNYDRIMLSTYRALNALHRGELDAARVHLRRVYNRQQEAVRRHAEQIARAKEAAEQHDRNRRSSVNLTRTMSDPNVQGILSRTYSDLDRFRPYAEFVNPFAEFLQGIYFTVAGLDGDDWERGRVALRRTAGMAPTNVYLRDDLAMAEARARGEPLPDVTYVIFQTGVAPWRTSIRIDLPLWLVNDEVDYVGVAFPKLVYQHRFARSLTVAGGGQVFSTQLISDMDVVVSSEFKRELPVTVTKTLMAAAAKAAIAYGASQATRDDKTWNDVVRILATGYQIMMNEADLRTWASLPKQFQYARLRTPEDGRLSLRVPGGRAVDVAVAPVGVNVVLVRSIHASDALRVMQFTLR